MPTLYRIFGFLRFIILFVYIHEKRETCRLQFGTRGFLDYLTKPNIYRTRLTSLREHKSLVLGLVIGSKVSSFRRPKFLAECFIIYVCCLSVVLCHRLCVISILLAKLLLFFDMCKYLGENRLGMRDFQSLRAERRSWRSASVRARAVCWSWRRASARSRLVLCKRRIFSSIVSAAIK